MFDEEEINKVLELQEKSYYTFMWFNKRIQEKANLTEEIHEKLSIQKAGAEWVNKHYKNLPEDGRPEKEDIGSFVNLLTSYLATSFILSKAKKVTDGCPCRFCTFLTLVNHLQVRNPSNAAYKQARNMKLNYIRGLAKELKRDDIAVEAELWLDSMDDIQEKIAIATYMTELVRRSKFYSQGEGALALWREIAWKDGHKDRNFFLSSRLVLDAEDAIIRAMEDTEFE